VTVERHGSGTPWEPIVGYAGVVRAGAHVWVSGCTAVGPDGVVLGETPREQMHQALANLVSALEQVGATPADVVRTRMFVTDISRWEEVGRAHGEVFADVLPATSMVEVSALIDPRMLVEIEAEAFVADATTSA
jgi:enamine deaminase RidA (YjgF/YER057c/UK114 family)